MGSIVELLFSDERTLEHDQIYAIVSTRANISGSTVDRRVHTLLNLLY